MPTYTSQASAADSFIISDQPNTNFGTSDQHGVGESNLAVVYMHGLIKFDLSSIPVSAKVVSAVLSLWHNAEEATNTRNFNMYRLLRNWTSGGVTWNKYDGTNAWGTAGGYAATDIDSTIIASLSMTGTEANGEKQWSLTPAEVRKLFDGTYTNYGWLMMPSPEGDDLHYFRSTDYATVGERPKLVIEYSLGGGSPMWWF